MLRFAAPAALLLLLLLATADHRAGPGLAHEATPGASPAATPAASPAAAPAALDLAAIALFPPDLDAVGRPGFGLQGGAMLTLDEQAERVAPDLGKDPAEVRAALAAAGFQRRYESQLGLPLRPGATPPRLRAFVASYVIEYATAEGAAAGFALLEDEAGGRMRDVRGARQLGDRSEVTLLRRREAGNSPYQALDLTFQLDNLVAGVTVAELGGREPDLALTEALGERLLAKVEAARAHPGPGLSNRVLRLGGEDLLRMSDEYGRLNGETFPNYNETPERFAERVGRYGNAIDVYGVWQGVPAAGAPRTDDVRYLTLLLRFDDPDAASAWLRAGPERTATSPNVVAATPVPEAAPIGDESLTLAITTTRAETETARGFLIHARVGAEVAQVQLTGVPDVPLAAVEELARAQVACLRAGACPERAPVPTGLPLPATPAPAATPVAASPVASPVGTPAGEATA